MRIITIIIFLFVLVTGKSQQPSYQYFDDTNGILDFEQYSVLQDKQKYIWIAGNSGVFKYNGIEFKTYRSSVQTNRALTNLRKDKYQRIWCHDFTGNIYYVEHDTLKLFKLWNHKQSSTFPVFEIIDEKLWVIYDEGISCYSIPENIKLFKHIKTLVVPNSRSACFFNSKMYISSGSEVISVDDNFNISYLKIDGNHLNDFLKAWSSYYISNNNLFLLSRQEKTVYKLSGSGFTKVFHLDFLPDIIGCKKINNHIWILTRSGAFQFDENYHFIKTYFKNIPVSDILIDHENNYWFSTLTKGVFIVPSLTSVIYRGAEQQGFTKLESYRNQLVAGGTDGNLYTISGDSVAQLIDVNNNKEISFIHSFNSELYFGNIQFLKLTSANELKNLGINPPFKQFKVINQQIALVSDPSGLYYYGLKEKVIGSNDVPVWAKNQVRELSIKSDNKTTRINQLLLSERTNHFYCANNFILASSKNGTYFISEKNKALQYFQNQLIFSNEYTGSDSCVYAATVNQGVLVFKNGIWQSLSDVNKKIHNQYIQKIKLVENDLWLATDEGIMKYELKSKQLFHFSEQDGLITYKINDLYPFKNKMYVATSKGLMSFPLNSSSHIPEPPPVILQGVICDNENLIMTNNIIEVKANASNITLNYDILAYSNPEAYILRYKINQSDYIALSERDHRIIINLLTPGINSLSVELYNKQLDKTVFKENISINVAYAFYQTWLFKLMVVCFIAILIILIVRKRILVIQQKNRELLEKEKLLNELKQSMLTSIKAQMNPHFIFNALNTIQSYVLKNDKLQANYYLGKFSDLIRKILQMSNKDSISVKEEIETLSLYLELENMRLNNELNYGINSKAVSDQLLQKIPSMIIQPFVENAIKHGLLHKKGNKTLLVEFLKENGKSIKVIITDNGIGRQASEQIKNRNPTYHQSFSSEANKKRLQLLNEKNDNHIGIVYEDCFDSNHYSSGTRVIISIPYS